MRKTSLILCASAVLLALAALPAPAAALTDCRMDYTLKGWSAVLKVSTGEGIVTCSNGQTAEVKLSAKGAGISAGKYEVRDGHGRFSDVSDISELFGSYAAGNVAAGLQKDREGLAMTKGNVSLALAGKGTGFELGVAVERFTITPRR